MRDENDSRRREILSTLAGLGIQGHLYRAPVAGRPIRQARDQCLRALVPDLLDLGVARLVIESCSQDRQDERVIQPILNRRGVAQFTWLHSAPAAEPLLWAADATAWALGKGGDWRRRVNDIVADIVDLP
ncbi:hypothetical protein [Kribbella sp. NPDC048915]|uniref:hypothetical protein n=1 Tax=Kribbella sp. NPDC048915 TaxID=3155148 RepID=UPI0033F5FFD7